MSEIQTAELEQNVPEEVSTEPLKSQNNLNDISNKKMEKKEQKLKKKDDKTIEQILKSLNSINNPEEKLKALCKKYTDILDENRKIQLLMKQNEKRLLGTQKEKEQLQMEHNKAVLTRSRLESLCRELQRQNKAIKDESLLKIREEEERRKEVSAKFQTTLAEITALMQQNNDKNSKLRDDNLEMTKQLKTVCEQYELREKQVNTVQKQMQLESQLSDAKFNKLRVEMNAEKEALLVEKQALLLELTQYQERLQQMQVTEIDLRNQITLYTSKYEEFQQALIRSNEVFTGFKSEMEKMTKKITKLEKETATWKQRWEKSHQALLEMAADRQQRDADLALSNRQCDQLQKLCRTLQTERATLLKKLKNSDSETSDKNEIDKPETVSTEESIELNQLSKTGCGCCQPVENKELPIENSSHVNETREIVGENSDPKEESPNNSKNEENINNETIPDKAQGNKNSKRDSSKKNKKSK